MKLNLLLLLMSVLLLSYGYAYDQEREVKAKYLLDYFSSESTVSTLNFIESFWKRSQEMQKKMELSDISFECYGIIYISFD